MLYRSVYLEADGSQATAVIEARDEQQLHETLRANGRLLLDAKSSGARGGGRRSTARFPQRKLMLFAQSMESSMGAGVPVLTALEAIRQQENEPSHRAVFDELIASVQGGESLAQAMANHPRVFSPMLCALVTAGESSGSLPESFARSGSFLEWREELRATVRTAIAYPTIVLAAAYGLVLFLLGFVIPGLNEVIAKLGAAELPLASRILIQTSNLIADHIGLVLASTVAFVMTTLALLRTDRGRASAAAVLVRLPLVRDVVQTINLAQLCRTLSVLLASGLTVIEAMRLTTPTLSLPRLRSALDQARDRILGGSKITESLEHTRLLPPIALSMITVGEKAGDMPRAFERLGSLYDRESKAAVKRALGMLEPIVTVGLGVVIGGIAAVVISTLYTSIGGLSR